MNRNPITSIMTLGRIAALGIAAALLLGPAAFGQTITNPSFEANNYTVAPGFINGNVPLTGWTANLSDFAGLNPAGGTNAFANNGAVPDGNNVAFLQWTGTALSSTIAGLTVGTNYKVQFRANCPTGQTAQVTVYMDADQAFPGPYTNAMTVLPVGSTNPYVYIAFEYTATAASQTLSLLNASFLDGAVLLLDDFKIAPSSGKWQVDAWTNDVTSGVDPSYVYTHAYSFGNVTNAVINGIAFLGVYGTTPAVPGSFSTTFLGSRVNNDPNNVTGGSRLLANDFLYGGTVPQGSYESITLQGLTPGKEYIATIYSMAWEDPSWANRWHTLSVGEDRLTINQDQFGNNNGIRFSYRYTADTNGTVTLRAAPINPGTTFHIYGFCNRETVSRNVAPVIAIQPQGATISAGVPMTLSTLAQAVPAPTYQWRLNGSAIPGANAATYTITAASAADGGKYDVVASNSSGSVTSVVATLLVGVPMTNPSFEADTFTVYPGYVSGNFPITGWTALGGHGINPGSDGRSPFANNGVWPHGKQAAFMQADGAMSQTVSGFTVGAPYYFHYYENSRSGPTPYVAVTFGTNTVIAAHAVAAVGGYAPFREVYSDIFTATATSIDLAFVKSNPLGGDSTALIDNVAFVQVPAGIAPYITRNVSAQIASLAGSATFSIQVIGSVPLNYQWKKNGAPIAGATNATLTLNNVQKEDEADYSVTTTNSFGTVTSAGARLNVFETIPDLFNTGVDNNRVVLAGGAVDPHFTLITNPDTNLTTAIVASTIPWGLANSATSKWIGPQPNTVNSATGLYVYRTVINLTNRDPKSVVILGQWATDNTGWDIQVNGVSTGVPRNTTQFSAFTSFALYGTNANYSFVAGTNTIDFVVNNETAPGYTGLRFEVVGSNVRVPAGTPAQITTQPAGPTGPVVVGDTVTFSGDALGSSPLGYWWSKNGVPIPGQTAKSLTLANVTAADSGAYTLSVSNAFGTNVSAPAQLLVAWRPISGVVFGTGLDASGALLADGLVDPHYKLTASADPFYPGPDALVISNGWPIAAGVWLLNGPNSKWIGPYAFQNQQLDPTQGDPDGYYTYQTSFNLAGYDLSQVQLVGGWAMDNYGADIIVNGVSTGATNSAGFGSLTSFTITNGLVAGSNTLAFTVYNLTNATFTPNPTGLRLDIKALQKLALPPTLTITRTGSTISISWAPTQAGQKLQSASDLKGPWSDIAGASNPYTTTAAGTKLFFRIVQ